ncbi:Hypothetical predicted protein [Pelobates cultripes]|uniref:Integrin beta epidermal growth factor-like domain-containing protein n=1 Tax=Pelobates cultripes TaxID=61616 RepID=A0AAD1R4X6_PELCU|nr:Hypothetical predicted protein [Pelobates cultripes]
MNVGTLVNFVWASSLFSLLAAVPASVSQKNYPSASSSSCKLKPAASEKRCRSPDGLICSGRGTCVCGVCFCEVKETGKYYGPLCECQDWVCHTYEGQTCAGRGREGCRGHGAACSNDVGNEREGERMKQPTKCRVSNYRTTVIIRWTVAFTSTEAIIFFSVKSTLCRVSGAGKLEFKRAVMVVKLCSVWSKEDRAKQALTRFMYRMKIRFTQILSLEK